MSPAPVPSCRSGDAGTEYVGLGAYQEEAFVEWGGLANSMQGRCRAIRGCEEVLRASAAIAPGVPWERSARAGAFGHEFSGPHALMPGGEVGGRQWGSGNR
jgi:hypothetical protein